MQGSKRMPDSRHLSFDGVSPPGSLVRVNRYSSKEIISSLKSAKFLDIDTGEENEVNEYDHNH